MKNHNTFDFVAVAVIIISLIVTGVLLLLSYSRAYCVSCVFAFKDEKIKNNVCVFESEKDICRVDIKAATSVYTFTEDGCKSGYCVSGIGTKSGIATVDETFKHDISHVIWYIYDDPTPVRVASFKSLGFISRLIESIKSLF